MSAIDSQALKDAHTAKLFQEMRESELHLQQQLAAALAERDALRADAERYRWICNGNGYFMEEHGLCGRWSEGHPEDKAEADKVIDAQMRKSPVEGEKHG